MTKSERNAECLRQKVKRHTGVLGVLYPNKEVPWGGRSIIVTLMLVKQESVCFPRSIEKGVVLHQRKEN